MLPRSARSIVIALLLAFGPQAAFADTGTAAAPAAAIAAFTGHAHAHLTLTINGAPIDVTAHLAVAQRDALSRADVTFDPGQFPLLPRGSITFVADGAKRTLTVWNATTKRYVVVPLAPALPGAAPAPVPAPRSAGPARSPFADLDVFALNVQLTGRGTVDGLATTNMSVSVDARRKNTSSTAHVGATMALADDFGLFPVTFAGTIDPGMPGFGATIDYALDDFSREAPPLTTFDMPSGYRPAASIFGVLTDSPVASVTSS